MGRPRDGFELCGQGPEPAYRSARRSAFLNRCDRQRFDRRSRRWRGAREVPVTALPTRKLEAYRYADIDALASVWSKLAAPERIEIAAQQKLQQIWLPHGEDIEVRRAEIILEPGAEFSLFALNTAREYGRIELDVTLREGARFSLNAANIGTGASTLEIVTVVRHDEPAAVSRQVVRSVLGGKAVGSYL